MDPTVQVALIGIIVAVITTAGLIVAAIINSRRERADSAQKAMERVYRERLNLKDDIIRELRSDLSELTHKLNKLEKAND